MRMLCGFFKELVTNKFLIYVAMHKTAPEAVFLLSKEKKETTSKNLQIKQQQQSDEEI